jgi:ABC-type transport system involved in multi-copper enzyme maturation permease subunit
VTGLVRAELTKVTTTRLVWGLLLGYVGFVVLNIVVMVFTAGSQGLPELDTQQAVRGVFASAGTGTVFSLVLGVVAMTGEFRHGTASTTFVAEPRRGRVVAAKAIALPVVTLGYALVGVAVTAGLGFGLLAARGVDAEAVDPHLGAVLAGAMASVALYSLLGVGLGSLIRNQVAAVVSALLWVMLVESALVAFLPEVGRWTPGGAASAMTLDEPVRGVDLLPPWAGAALFVAYGVALAALGARWTVRRDIT